MYVLFGVNDPIDIYDGLIGILRKLADKGKWVKMLWKTAVEGDFLEAIKLAWDGIMDTFGIGVKNSLPDWLLPDWFKEVKYEQKRFVSSVPFTNWKDNPDGLYTNYIIELRSDEREMTAHNARKKLISKGVTPPKEEPAADDQSADLIAAELTEDAFCDMAPPDPAEDPPRRRWYQRLTASLPRPAGRRERTREQS